MIGAVFLYMHIRADTQKGQPENPAAPFYEIMADRLFIFRGFS